MGASWTTFIPRNRILRFSNNSCSIHLRRKKWKCVYNTNPKTTSRKNVCTKTHLYRDHQTAPPSTKPFKMPVNSEMAPWTAWNEWCTTEKYICILFATAVSVVISFRCHDSSSRALTSWLIKNCILNSTIRWYQCMRAVVIFLSPRGWTKNCRAWET